ncbi:export-related chaperone protein CsaA [Neorhodopirellula lusitana]|uniref:Export-related chaperone protein CsaA n=1 Tax=Neorhodopirellula lusitana TaxID=445327 RepID=A0ABY1Q587_9BACT|nr:tRNA-binding protein [Neorhodopirellula lusitana]SMP59379.1 export-related chaperone protein CsaA [Neorhodopirellula lusitana]
MSDYPHHFHAKIDENLVRLPDDIVAKLDFSQSKRLRIDGEVNGIRIECALMPMKGKWFFMVSKKLQKLCGVMPGDSVGVSFDIANPNVVEVPNEMQFALEANDAAMEAWLKWTPGKRRSAMHGVLAAKRPETRERRVEEVIGMLLGSRVNESGIITMQEFDKVDLRAGTITSVKDFPKARKPAYQVTVDFGPNLGSKRTSTQITVNYTRDELVGRQVIGVLNFGTKQIGPFMSEFLIVGFYREDGSVILAVPDQSVPNGAKLA